MEEEQQAGVARLLIRTKEDLAAIRPSDGRLLLERLFFGEEIRDPQRVEQFQDFEAGRDHGGRELKVARDLVASLSRPWDPTRYTDTHRDRVLQIIEQKANGEDIVTEPTEEAEATDVSDLMSVLEASFDQAHQAKRSTRSRPSRRSRRATSGSRLERLTKEELYERAQARGIAGRSRMSKTDLVDAIKEAS